MQIINKVFVVTGAGNGIGREVALQILAKGGKVAAIDIDQAGLKTTLELAQDNLENISIHQADLTDLDQIEKLKEQIIKIHQVIDGLMNVAGIVQPFISVNEIDYRKVHQVMNVNFFGTLHMVKTFLPILLSRPEAHITNVSSMGSFVPVPGQSVYGASKAAVNLLTLGLRSELKDTPVGVTLILPGGVATDIVKNSGVNLNPQMVNSAGSNYKLLTPKKAAELIIKATEKNKYRVPIGQDAKFMNFLAKLCLNKAANLIAKKISNL
ncbi:MAG TPA: SDR family NAD(P)-dependent oxidoreductase [Bacilli bacterium]|nr:SDR family NAD(P)-dependent oxidoreductase [Bacilli bacterium]